ncbi:MAG: precorrin-8X methylmutase [Ardenticatenia bacterium]|nr:precorrin-8X methylmutase [Ardenticatenia bacterium]
MNTPDPGAHITAQSLAIVRQELARRQIVVPPPLEAVVERVVHSTADVEYATLLRASPGAVEAGVAALRRGCAVVTDVNMVRVGISPRHTATLGARVVCFVGEPDVAQAARRAGLTRSAMGIRRAAEQGLVAGGLVAVGNAPTALDELLRLVTQGLRPALIVGVPVGFVGAAESKAALMNVTTVPWITVEGIKGGSAVAVAIVNALLIMAESASGLREQ